MPTNALTTKPKDLKKPTPPPPPPPRARNQKMHPCFDCGYELRRLIEDHESNVKKLKFNKKLNDSWLKLKIEIFRSLKKKN